MALKTYVLLDHMRPTAPMFVQVNANQRVKIDSIPNWQPNLQLTFLDERPEVVDYDIDNKETYGKLIPNKRKGRNRTARLKLNSNTPWQDEQIEKEKIPANEKFSQDEYVAAKFIHNVLITDNPAVQNFLENIPEMEGFIGRCEHVKRPSYKLYDENMEIDHDNYMFTRRLEGATKISKLSFDDAVDMLIRIYGTAYRKPLNIKQAQNELVAFMDSSDEALDEILKTDTTIDDEVNILLGRLVGEGKISFDAVADQVVKRKGADWIPLRDISNEYDPATRQRYFVEFLTSPEGKLMLDDLKKEAGKKKKEAAVA
jgi:hypothetical protein